MRITTKADDAERARAMRLLRLEIEELKKHRRELADRLRVTQQREDRAVRLLEETRTAVTAGHRRMVRRMDELEAENERLRAVSAVSLVKESSE